jgi:hypothetical protein
MTRENGCAMTEAPLWRCPVCGQSFVSRNMPHSCQVVPLDAHFDGKPELRAVFDALVAAARENGPVTINATKSRVALQVRMRFAGIERPRTDHLLYQDAVAVLYEVCPLHEQSLPLWRRSLP